MQTVPLQLMRTAGADPSIPLPGYETAGAAGADVRANVPGGDAVVIAPGARALIPTGIAMAVPAGYEVQVRPRSGLALRHGVA
ncbi:MAG: dUTP diphosphatase, partial [Pseudomonadota bacterium]